MGTNRIKGLQVIYYLLIINFIFDLVLTLVNCIIIPNYFSELLYFSLLNVVVFSVVLILVMIITIIPVIYGQQYKDWSDEFALKFFFRMLAILSVTIISIASIIIFLTLYSNYPTLDNPFSLSNSSRILTVLSPFWWFFSFNVGIILIFLLYIYLES